MRSKNEPNGQKRSFIEEARRAQIIAAAIETIAEVGYSGASLSRIAGTAGISKGVISYHFAGKDELMHQVVVDVYTEIVDAILPGILEQESGADMLRAHVRGVAEYALANPGRMATLTQIFTHARKADGTPRYGTAESDTAYESLEGLYRSGQDSGEFRDFDVRVMAVTQQAAIDAMFAYWNAHPGHDLTAHARELGELLVRAARAD